MGGYGDTAEYYYIHSWESSVWLGESSDYFSGVRG